MQYASSYSCPIAYTPLGIAPNNRTSANCKRRPPIWVSQAEAGSIKSHHFDNSSNWVVAETTRLPPNVKSVTSTSNPFVKHCVKLRQNSSYRHSHGSALILGTTLIREIHEFHMLKHEQQTAIECLFLLDRAEVPEEISDIPGDRVHVSSLVMKKLSGVQSTESIEAIALMSIPPTFLDLNDTQTETNCKRWFPCHHRILVLEGVQDPGNLGTLLRSALAFKWNGVFLLPGCCDPFNEKALRASRGAPFQIPIVSGSWTHLEALRNEVQVKILAGHPNSSNTTEPVSELSPGLATSLADTPLCLLLGSEGTGLSGKAIESCKLVSIPMSDHFESLNVAVAGGIFMFVLKS